MSDEVKVFDIPQKFKELDTTKDGISSAQAKEKIDLFGYNELSTKKQSRLKKFLLTYWGPIPWLIEVAAILSLVIQHWADFFIIAFLLILNSLIEFIQEAKASSALDALKKSMALKARAKRDNKWTSIDAREVVVGDIVNLSNGDIIPADCLLVDGDYLSIDQAALTGESLPVNRIRGNEVYSGSIVKQGDMTCLVTATGEKTFFGRTAKLVQSAGNISHFQKSVLNIGKFLIYSALILAVLIVSKEFYVHANALNTIQLVLVLIIASIPVAMPAVLSVTMALGALSLSKKKAIVSRLPAIEELAGVDLLCSDKTGTLTKNELTLNKPILYSATSANELNLMAALASNIDGKDAIDTTIVSSANKAELSKYKQTRFKPFDPIGKKTTGYVEYDGKSFQVIKGAPQVIIDICIDDKEIKEKANADVHNFAINGLRALGVAKTDSFGNYKLLGILSLYDPPRADSKQTILEAHKYGINVKMVTGDDIAIGKQISGELGLGTNMLAATDIFEGEKDIAHLSKATEALINKTEGYARVFPEHKYGIVKAHQDSGLIVAMTGDGVNDAPALKQADVGIAVSGATDAARSAADLILTAPGLSVITHAVEESRRIFSRMITYVNYRVAMTINIMLFVTLSMIFNDIIPITAIMIVFLALLDDIPIMAIAYDNTRTRQHPVKWDLKRVISSSILVGILSVLEAFGMLHIAGILLNHSLPQVQTMMFLQLVVSGALLLFVSRNTTRWLWSKPFPSKVLFGAIGSTQLIAILICGFGIFVPQISWIDIIIVWAYAIVWILIINIVRNFVYNNMYNYYENRFTQLNKNIFNN